MVDPVHWLSVQRKIWEDTKVLHESNRSGLNERQIAIWEERKLSILEKLHQINILEERLGLIDTVPLQDTIADLDHLKEILDGLGDSDRVSVQADPGVMVVEEDNGGSSDD